jgi:hypothetical protein
MRPGLSPILRGDRTGAARLLGKSPGPARGDREHLPVRLRVIEPVGHGEVSASAHLDLNGRAQSGLIAGVLRRYPHRFLVLVVEVLEEVAVQLVADDGVHADDQSRRAQQEYAGVPEKQLAAQCHWRDSSSVRQ